MSEKKAPEAKTAEKPKTVTVRVSDRIAQRGGAFYDPAQNITIGKEPVEVEKTAFVAEKLRNEELVEA